MALPTNSPTNSSHILQGRQIVCQRFCGRVGVHISSYVACSVSSLTNLGVNPSWHQFNFSIFIEFCRCCYQQWVPNVSWQRASFCLSNSLDCWGISIGLTWPTTQLNAMQFRHWKPCLATRDSQLRLHIPHYYEFSLGSPS